MPNLKSGERERDLIDFCILNTPNHFCVCRTVLLVHNYCRMKRMKRSSLRRNKAWSSSLEAEKFGFLLGEESLQFRGQISSRPLILDFRYLHARKLREPFGCSRINSRNIGLDSAAACNSDAFHIALQDGKNWEPKFPILNEPRFLWISLSGRPCECLAMATKNVS